jgi:hypothetical protein
MIDIVSSLAKGVFEKGHVAFTKHGEFKYLVSAFREQLRRELRLNVEIIDELILRSPQSKAIEANQYINAFESLRTGYFDSLAAGVVPLSALLPNEIDEKIYPKSNKQYIKNCSNDKTLHQLIERTYFRLEVAKIFSRSAGSKIDIGYLKFLILASVNALK